jgi:predicted dienelactone hydrolase
MKLVLKIAGGLAAALVLAVAGLFGVLLLEAERPARPVGLQQMAVPDPGRAPIQVTVFYPTTGKPRPAWLGGEMVHVAADGPMTAGVHPLVIISHGTAGSSMSHLDTALALAEAGYVVAAPMHTGDNFRDQSAVGGPDWMVDRTRHLARVGEFMLSGWTGRGQIDARRVGLFGYSAGATSALMALGGRPDFGATARLCQTRPEFICRIVKPGPIMRSAGPGAGPALPQARAAVIVAPGFGFAFEPAGLSKVTAPVQLWEGDQDVQLPLATNALAVRRLLPARPDFHLVRGAGHFSFLAPCGITKPLLPPMLCQDSEGFDRAQFHQAFNAQVVRFYDRSLASPGGAG